MILYKTLEEMNHSKDAPIQLFRQSEDNVLQPMTYYETGLKLNDLQYAFIQPFRRTANNILQLMT